jgi:hypothetical protein
MLKDDTRLSSEARQQGTKVGIMRSLVRAIVLVTTEKWSLWVPRIRLLWLAQIPSATFWMRNSELTGIGSVGNLPSSERPRMLPRCSLFSN